jgi:hypothetical protein
MINIQESESQNENQKRQEEKTFEEIMSEKLPNLMKSHEYQALEI